MSLSKSKAKELLQESVDAIVDLQQSSYGSDQFTKWKRDTEVAIERIFPADSRHLSNFKSRIQQRSATVDELKNTSFGV